MSWADIRNNGAVVTPDTNPHNEDVYTRMRGGSTPP